MLSKYIELVVKIDNKLYNFNVRKKGYQPWKEPRMSNYQANDKQPFQQRNQPRYEVLRTSHDAPHVTRSA